MKISKLLLVSSLSTVLLFSGCKKGDFNLFSLEDDKKLGQQTVEQIKSDPSTYPLLDRTQYASQYAYLENMKTTILNGGKLQHASDFEWTLYIIKDDKTLNAFCTPGGYIFVYTGLIKYLDNASSLAGVMGHEMGHADLRHSTTEMTKQYGIQTMLDVVLGKNQNQLTQIANQLVALKFSRTDESNADKQSVSYLCPTKYRAEGAADFFIKLSGDPNYQSSSPEFLSTHPNPDNRVANIKSNASQAGCTASIVSQQEFGDYNSFKSSLP